MDNGMSRRTLLRAGGAAAAGALGLQFAASAAAASPTAAGGRKAAALTGPTMQVDPVFPYYLDRSVDSVAEELELAGYRNIRVVVTSETTNANGALVRALRKRGIATWFMVFGNGTYNLTGFPEQWRDWQMGLIKPSSVTSYTFFSHFNAEYRQWKKEVAAALVRDHPVDGYEVVESFFPEWNGLESGVYGDVSPLGLQTFRDRYGQEPPNFTDPESPLYYNKPENAARYQQWIDLRVHGVNNLLDEIFNGPGGVRDARPDILVATWSLAIDGGPDSARRLREWQGIDAAAMVQRVRPDLHFLQTHWPDWIRPDLPPDYARAYLPFAADVRRVAPGLPIGVQADIGSLHDMEHDRAWLDRFSDSMDDLGYDTWTYYEHHIGGAMYGEPPRPLVAKQLDGRRVRVSFNKRIDEESAALPGSFVVREAGDVEPTEVKVDGNRAELTFRRLPGGPFEIHVSQVRDTPKYWLYEGHGHPANVVPAGARIRVR